MMVFALLVIAVCVVVILKANRVLAESELSEPEPDYRDWQFPPKWHPSVARTEER